MGVPGLGQAPGSSPGSSEGREEEGVVSNLGAPGTFLPGGGGPAHGERCRPDPSRSPQSEDRGTIDQHLVPEAPKARAEASSHRVPGGLAGVPLSQAARLRFMARRGCCCDRCPRTKPGAKEGGATCFKAPSCWAGQPEVPLRPLGAHVGGERGASATSRRTAHPFREWPVRCLPARGSMEANFGAGRSCPLTPE